MGHYIDSKTAAEGVFSQQDSITDKHSLQLKQDHRENGLSIRELMKKYECTEDCVKSHLHTWAEIQANALYLQTGGKEGEPLPYADLLISSEQKARAEISDREAALAAREKELAEREAALSGPVLEESFDSSFDSEALSDEFGPLKGSPEWEQLGATAKGALTKKRNQAAEAA